MHLILNVLFSWLYFVEPKVDGGDPRILYRCLKKLVALQATMMRYEPLKPKGPEDQADFSQEASIYVCRFY